MIRRRDIGIGLLVAWALLPMGCTGEGDPDGGTASDSGPVDAGRADAGPVDAGDDSLDCHEDAEALAVGETWLGRNFLYYIEWTQVQPEPPAIGDNAWTFVVRNSDGGGLIPEAYIDFEVTSVDESESLYAFQGLVDDTATYSLDGLTFAGTGALQITLAISPGVGGEGDTVQEVFCVVDPA